LQNGKAQVEPITKGLGALESLMHVLSNDLKAEADNSENFPVTNDYFRLAPSSSEMSEA